MLNRPTNTDNGQLLNSGGIVYVNATQNGESLIINGGLATTIPFPTGFVGNPTSPILLFFGDTTVNGDFVWVQDTGNVAAVWDSIQGDYFSFAIDSVGWTNVDQIAGNAPFTTGVSVDLPPGHD